MANASNSDDKRIPKLPAPYDPASDIIRPKHLPHATGLSAVTVWRERRAGRFPQPIQLTPGGAKGWTRPMIERWREQRARMGHSPEAA